MPVEVECPCGKRFNIKDEFLGSEVECGVCKSRFVVQLDDSDQEEIQIPQAIEPQVETETFECAFCAEQVPVDCVICPHCDSKLTTVIPQSKLQEYLAEATEKLDALTQTEDKFSKIKAISQRTWVLFTLSFLSLAALAGGVFIRDGEGIAVLGGFVLFICGISFLVAFSNDNKTKLGKSDADPAKTVKAFLKSVLTKRAERAFARLAPEARHTKNAETPLFQKVKPPKQTSFNINSVKDLKAYWESFTKSESGIVRGTQLKKVRVVEETDRYAIVEADLKLSSYPSILVLFILINIIVLIIAVLIATKRETIKVRKLLIKGNDGRWYIAESEFKGKLDSIELS